MKKNNHPPSKMENSRQKDNKQVDIKRQSQHPKQSGETSVTSMNSARNKANNTKR